jgi:hypothetical protein
MFDAQLVPHELDHVVAELLAVVADKVGGAPVRADVVEDGVRHGFGRLVLKDGEVHDFCERIRDDTDKFFVA